MKNKKVGIRFLFYDDLFNTAAKEKKTKREKRNVKRSYNKERQSKRMDT